jgi:FkbM family methyltransferase
MRVFDWASQLPALRRFILPLLRKFSFDFQCRHAWVDGLDFCLNSFLHKGYWFFGAERERHTMILFARLISPGMHIVEVGGHIGFISGYFAKLTGPSGSVTVFEPGRNNLKYTRQNISTICAIPTLANVNLVEMAVGEHNGTAHFFEDNLTGQNNSLVKNFKGLKNNAELSYNELKVAEREVKIVSLDSFFHKKKIDFVKIDVEGFEYGVLKGMLDLIKINKPAIMVEIQANEFEIWDFLNENNYILIDENCNLLKDPSDLSGNIFCLSSVQHGELIKEILRG